MPDDRKTAAKTARRQREIQSHIDETKSAADKHARKDMKGRTGARRQPENPMPAQHLKKPGNEKDLELKPRFLAPDYKGSGKLAGMNALITGGDSGIGRAVAVLFAREGANVAIVYLEEHDDARETRKHVLDEGVRCLLIPGDVRDSGFCNRAVEQTVEAFGSLHVLVNNAGFQQHAEAIEDITDEHFNETVQTNIGGYFYMARAAIPKMKAGASIVNTGSETALFGSKELLDYSATKGAIHAFTKSLASHLQKRGIRVNAVAPGPVWTPFNPADREGSDVADFGKDSDMGRPAQPEEIAPAFVFLAAPCCSSYVNGVVLPVMGGPRG